MIPFNAWIKINNCPTEFSFRKVHAPNQDKFFITMMDSDSNNISFDMIMNSDGKWSIFKPAPEAIVAIKEKLIKIIEKHCSLKPILFPSSRSIL
jgi:hypothetical protein